MPPREEVSLPEVDAKAINLAWVTPLKVDVLFPGARGITRNLPWVAPPREASCFQRLMLKTVISPGWRHAREMPKSPDAYVKQGISPGWHHPREMSCFLKQDISPGERSCFQRLMLKHNISPRWVKQGRCLVSMRLSFNKASALGAAAQGRSLASRSLAPQRGDALFPEACSKTGCLP